MSFVPSIRSCLEQASSLQDTPAIIAGLQQLDDELRGGETSFPEIAAALNRLRALQGLVDDMAANMRNGGHSRAPQAPAPPRLPAQSVYQSPRSPAPAVAKPPIGDWPTTAKKAAAAKKAPAAKQTRQRTPAGAPVGSITTAAAVKRLGVSTPTFYKLRAKPEFPQPLGRYGGICMYSAEAIDAYTEHVRTEVQALQRQAAAKR